MSKQQTKEEVSAEVQAMDLFNIAMNREIVAAREDVAVELARIKYNVNQKFYRDRQAKA